MTTSLDASERCALIPAPASSGGTSALVVTVPSARTSTWNLQFKGATFLSFTLAGLAIAWVRPFEVYWPVFLVILVVGTASALRVNLPTANGKIEVVTYSNQAGFQVSWR